MARPKNMTESEFAAEIRTMIEEAQRRIARLRAVADGDLRLKRVLVKSYTVREHEVGSHWRYIMPTRRSPTPGAAKAATAMLSTRRKASQR